MKLLFIIPYAPTQIRTRPYHFIRFLSRRGHAITLATLYNGPEERRALRNLEGEGINVHAFPQQRLQILTAVARAFVAGNPLQSAYSQDRRLEQTVRQILASGNWDLVHIEHLRGAAYVGCVQNQAGPRLPVVWDSVDSISHLFSQATKQSVSLFGRIVSRLELARTRRFEGRMVHRFDQVVVTSQQDQETLLHLAARESPAPPPPISVVPNGVDTEVFFPIDAPLQRDTIIFTGKMSYHANITAVVQFVRDVMPLIWRDWPDVKLQVVGKDPSRQVRKLGEEDARVQVLGAVDHMQPYLAAATVAVAPITYGAGIQNKVLEAMACQTAVVASSRAASALRAVRGEDLIVADRAEAVASAVLQLLRDPEYRDAIARSGREYVLKTHRWEDVVSRLEELYCEAIKRAH